MSTVPEPYMTGPEICQYLRIDASQLSRMARRDVNRLPAYKHPGVGFRARRTDLDAWMTNQEVAA